MSMCGVTRGISYSPWSSNDMIAGVRGRLISATFAETALHTLPGAAVPSTAVAHALDAWSDRRESTLGPTSSVRSIVDAAVIPLLKILGFEIGRRIDEGTRTVLEALASSETTAPVVIVPWNEPLDGGWRALVLDGVRADARWCFCCNGAGASRCRRSPYVVAALSRIRPGVALAGSASPDGPLERDSRRGDGRSTTDPGPRNGPFRPPWRFGVQGPWRRRARRSWTPAHRALLGTFGPDAPLPCSSSR